MMCWRLARTKASLRTIRNKRCRGCVADRAHASHQLQWTAGVWWCGLCGRFATNKPQRLLESCPGAPFSDFARRCLRAFRSGHVVPGRGYLKDLAWHLETDVGRVFCEMAVEAAFQRWFANGGAAGIHPVCFRQVGGVSGSEEVALRARSFAGLYRGQSGVFRSALKMAPGYLRLAACGYAPLPPQPRTRPIDGARSAASRRQMVVGIGALLGGSSVGPCRICAGPTVCICRACRQRRCLRCTKDRRHCCGQSAI